MNKVRQKYLQQWLRSQQKPIKKLMRANIALATLSALILVVQTYFLATLLDKLIMQNVPRDELIPYFLGLIIGFGMRAIILWVREKIGFRSGQLLRNHIRQKNSG
ncbi:cysteine/glutathione ABC transporter membrane/ATP-binding component [Haemophilus influenzae PittII]|nr:cysteine/glutathione ABC transporter membrane/ATP-binding component [Haemophilus influenzae PittII]